MARRSDHSREELRDMALTAAEALIATEGLAGLSTRKVAQRMGYTVGTLYLVFRNLDDLILQINARTLTRLHQRLLEVQTSMAVEQPPIRVLALCQAYYQFACQQEPLWSLVYQYRLPAEIPMPAWFEARVDELIYMVSQELAQMLATQKAADTRLAARTLWGGVHGICMLALSGKLSVGDDPVSADILIESLVVNYLTGLRSSNTTTRVGVSDNDSRGHT